MAEKKPIIVRTLLGSKVIDSSIICLTSVLKYSADPIRIVVHDDGTLNQADEAALARIGGDIRFVHRTEADKEMSELLARYPHCRAARDSGPLFLKLFDIALLSTNVMDYIDSDVYFLRRFTGLFGRGDGSKPTFMTDMSHAYSVRPWRVRPLGHIRLAGRVNTGLILNWKVGLDLDFLEWLLGRLIEDGAAKSRKYWMEQTCWAALAARTTSYLVHPSQIILASNTMSEFNSNVIGIHFVSTYRDRLATFQVHQRDENELPVEILAQQTQTVTTFDLLAADWRRSSRAAI